MKISANAQNKNNENINKNKFVLISIFNRFNYEVFVVCGWIWKAIIFIRITQKPRDIIISLLKCFGNIVAINFCFSALRSLKKTDNVFLLWPQWTMLRALSPFNIKLIFDYHEFRWNKSTPKNDIPTENYSRTNCMRFITWYSSHCNASGCNKDQFRLKKWTLFTSYVSAGSFPFHAHTKNI